MVGGIIGAFAIVIAIAGGVIGGGVIDDVSGGSLISSGSPPEIFPLILELDDVTIVEIVDNTAYMGITFKVTNPNNKSILLQTIKYTVYGDELKIGSKSIGDRGAPGGLVAASNYFTILNDRPTILKDEFTINNDGSIPEIWTALETDTANWRITGDAFYNLSSMTAGGENEISFDFVL